MPPTFEGYNITETIHEGERTIVYRAVKEDDGSSVIIKTCRRADDVYRLRRTYDLLKDRQVYGVPDVVDIVYFEERAAVIKKDVGGLSLHAYAKNNAIDEQKFLTIAANATRALAAVHEAGILHRDVKPANMLIDPETLKVWVIDFGTAHTIGRPPTEGMEGTVEFISPEQTGRVYGTVDERSDLYSLGVAFYMLITGHLPFTGATPLEIIHGHIAMTPQPPKELAAMNGVTSDIILKLMEKAPDKRYQSAAALVADLERVETELRVSPLVMPFRLGEGRSSRELFVSDRLFGKEREQERLYAALERCRGGKPQLVIISGKPDTGKSALLHDFKHKIDLTGGNFIVIEFDSARHSDPHYAYRAGFERFYRAFKARVKNPEPLHRKLRETLGENGYTLRGVFADAPEFLGDAPEPAAAVGPAETIARREQAFAGLVRAFAQPSYPAVMIMENMQWADYVHYTRTLSFLKDKSIKYLMVVWVIRDGMNTNPNFARAMAEMFDASFMIDRIEMKNYDEDTVREVLEDALKAGEQTPPEEIGKLAEYAYGATQGNPSALKLFLGNLYREGLLVFNGAEERWEWELDKIINTDGLLDERARFNRDVAELPDETREDAVFLAFCGDSGLTADTVSVFSGGEITAGRYRKAADALAGLGMASESSGSLYFEGDSAELFRALATAEERLDINYAMGQNLLAAYGENPEALEYHRGDICDHLNASGKVIPGTEQALALAALNYETGSRQMTSGSYEAAGAYFAYGMGMLGADPFERDEGLAFKLRLAYADCLYSGGKPGGREEGEALYGSLSEYIKTDDDKYQICIHRLRQYHGVYDFAKTAETATEYLTGRGLLRDERYPGLSYEEAAAREYEILEGNFAKASIDTALNRANCGTEEDRRVGTVLCMMLTVREMQIDMRFTYGMFLVTNQLYVAGAFEHLETCLRLWAIYHAERGEMNEAERMVSRALAFAERFNAPKGNIYFYSGMRINHWVRPAATGTELYKLAKQSAISDGNLYLACAVDNIALDIAAYKGMNAHKLLKEADNAADAALKLTGSRSGHIFASAHRQYAKCLLGKTAGTDTFDDKGFAESDFLATHGGDHLVLGYYYMYKLIAQCIHGYYAEAIDTFHLLQPYSAAVRLCLVYADTVFFAALAMTRLGQQNPAVELQLAEERVNLFGRVRQWAETCPENFRHKAILLDAESRRLGAPSMTTLELYAEARGYIEDGGFDLDYAILEECLYEFWLSLGVQEYVAYHKREAKRAYSRLGMKPKAWQFTYEDEHSLKREQSTRDSASVSYGERTDESGTMDPSSGFTANSSTANPSTAISTYRQLSEHAGMDYRTLLSVINDLSGELDVERLAGRFLTTLVQYSGARRGMIAILRDETPMIYGAVYVEPGVNQIPAALLPLPANELDPRIAPLEVISAVISKCSGVVVNSAVDTYMFHHDPYIAVENPPESFLCLPLIFQGSPGGAVYLEHAKLPGVFTDSQARVCAALLNQAAPFFQSAVFYDDMSRYAKTVERQLQEHIGNLNSLIAGIAHEINTPVGVCVTVISRMKENTADVAAKLAEGKLGKAALTAYMEDTGQGLEICTNNITRAAGLIKNFKRMSVDQSNEQFEWLEMVQTVRDIISYVQPAVKKQIGEIEIIAPESLHAFSCAGTLAQIFTNLTMNASIHAFEHMAKADCKVTIRIEQAGGNVQIIFADNGCGMDEEALEKLFQPFYTTKRGQGGSGLGTHIIQTLVSQTLGGSVKCVSAPGKGTSFIMLLPTNRVGRVGAIN